MKWYCKECGYIFEAEDAPDDCLHCNNGDTFDVVDDSMPTQKWYCNNCKIGYEFVDGYEPQKCYKCNLDVSHLDKLEEDDSRWLNWVESEQNRLKKIAEENELKEKQKAEQIKRNQEKREEKQKAEQIKRNQENSEDKQQSGIDWVKVIIGIMVVFTLIIYLLIFMLDEPDESYYIDYNNNGRMDEGEHVYDVVDGEEHWDLDGDGWWDN